MRQKGLLRGKAKRFILSMVKGPALSMVGGFTLVELLVALAVGSVILTGAVQSIYQVLVFTERNTNKVISLADINQAALALKNDLLMAQTTDLSSVPKSSANLTWTDLTTSFDTIVETRHSASYRLSGRELRRTYDGVESIVGRNVLSVNFTQNDKLVTVVISTSNSTLSSRIETLTFSVHLRFEEL